MTLQHPHAELSAYIDDALDPAAKAAVDGHLVTCALCRAHVAQLRATVAFVQTLPDPIPSRRLVPRLATPAWLAPLRTLMSLASGAAVFLFIASALVSNITFLASGGATGTTALEASRDTATKGQAPAAAQPASSVVPTPATSDTAFGFAPTPSPAGALRSTASGPAPADAPKRADQATAGPSGAPENAAAAQDAARSESSRPQPSPLLNPWLWLTLAIVCGLIAVALQRRLRSSV